jgi:hypothetical protein
MNCNERIIKLVREEEKVLGGEESLRGGKGSSNTVSGT